MLPATEHDEQVALVQRCRYSGYPYNLIYSNPNAGKRTVGAARFMIAEGLTAGIPDLFLPVAKGGYHGLYIELKRREVQKRKDGGLSYEQQLWIDTLRAEGYRVDVAYGQDQAWTFITEYVQGKLIRDSSLQLREAIEL